MSSDYELEDTVYLPFTTRAFATGIPTALVSGVVDIYEDATATPIITGETLAVTLNSVAGFNMITVTATAATGFGAGQSYTAILQAGTVGTVSVVGEVAAHFTLGMSSAAKDLANATDGLGALKAETATMQGDVTSILADTGELQVDDIPGKIAALDAVVDSLTLDVAAIPTTAMRGTDNAATASALTTVDNEIAALQGNVTDILADTNELQTDDIPGKIAALDIVVDTVKAETALILADTNELQLDDIPGKIAALDAVVDTVKDDTALILVDTGELQVDDIPGKIAALDAVVDTVKADTALILVDTGELQVDDIPGKIAALDAVVDTVKAETVLILADTVELQKGIIYGVAEGSPTSTTCPTALTAYADDQLIGRVLIVTSGACDGEATDITDYALATGLLTFTALTTNMSAADTFKIV